MVVIALIIDELTDKRIRLAIEKSFGKQHGILRRGLSSVLNVYADVVLDGLDFDGQLTLYQDEVKAWMDGTKSNEKKALDIPEDDGSLITTSFDSIVNEEAQEQREVSFLTEPESDIKTPTLIAKVIDETHDQPESLEDRLKKYDGYSYEQLQDVVADIKASDLATTTEGQKLYVSICSLMAKKLKV